jgi:hypothetical protein
MFNYIKEISNRILNKKISYKCIAYVSDGIEEENKIVETFELEEFSYKKAQKTAFEMLKFKYPNKGFDIRIH